MRKYIVAALVAVCAFANVWAVVVRYDSAAMGTGDGKSWANAYTDIALAISAASTAGGGEVWVKQGTHRTPNGGFSLANGVTVKGGFKGEDGVDDATRDVTAYETILKPDSGNYLVRQSVNCDGTAILDGVTLTDAQHAYDNTADYSQPLFRDCIFRGKAGVGVRSGTKAGVDFSGCTFDNISGGYNWGTINCEKGGPNTYTDCTFKNCWATGYGLVQNNVTTTFTRCRFENNRAQGKGYLITYHSAAYDDCTFVGNVMTNGTSLAVFSRLRNCVVASNAVVNLNAAAGQSALLTSQDPQWTSTLRTPVERCSFLDNKVIRLGPLVTEKSVVATLVHFARTGNALVGSTFARNVCTATCGSVDASVAGAVVVHTSDNYGGVIACTFVDNACSTADIVDFGRTSGSHSLIANCLFRRANAIYSPIRGFKLDTATKGFHVADSFIQNYDATAFKLIEATNVTSGEPLLYNLAFAANGHLYAALRTGAAETTAVPDVTVATGGGLYAVAGRYAGWTEAPTGTAENLKDLVTGEARPSDGFTCGPTQTSVAKTDKFVFRARVTPVGSGDIVGATDQDVAPDGAVSSVTASTESSSVVFKGWRVAGTSEIISIEATYSVGTMSDDVFVEAVFGVPKVVYTYELGGCGTFDENHLPTTTREYEMGAVPEYPAYTPTPNWHLVGWDQALPATVGDTTKTFTMRGFEKVHRIRRCDSQAAAGGDGTTWATAYNSLSAAIADAGQWTGEVWIKEGLHKLTEADGASLMKNVAVRGGFAGVDGAFANDDAERAARDFTAHYTALQGKTTDGYVFKQTTDADATSTVDSLAFTNTQYAYFSTRANTKPVFTNCWFVGKAGLFANASGANLTVVDSRIENISGGNSWGPIHVEGQGNGLFGGCTVKRCVGTTNYGIFDLVGKTVFTNCLFAGNTSAGYLVNAPNSTSTEFYGCRFVTNRLTTSGGGYYLVEGLKFLNCSFVSNVVMTTGTATGDLRLVHATGETTVENTTFFANEMVRDQSTLAGATVNAALIPLANWKMNLINCTFARNVMRTTVGEGTTVRSATLLTSGNYGFTIRNSTFVDNDVETAEIVEVNRTSSSGFDTVLENTVCRNENAGYCPIRTLGTSTSRVTVNSCVLPGYDTSLFGYKGGNSMVLTAQPAMRSRPVWEKDQLCYVLRKNAAYKDFCVAGPATDIVGNPRPAGEATPGSYQPIAREGFALIVR